MNSNTSVASVSMLSGVEGIQQVYERCLSQESVDFVCLSENYDKVLGSYYDQDFAPRLKVSEVRTREVVGGKGEAVVTGKNQVKYVPDKSEADCIYTPGFVALISFDATQPQAVVIEDKGMVKSLRIQFEGFWKSLV